MSSPAPGGDASGASGPRDGDRSGDRDPSGSGESGSESAGDPAPSNRRLWTAVIFLNVALTGAMLQARGAVLPTLEATFRAPEWQLGLVATAGTVGYLVVILVVGGSAGRVDARRGIVLGLGGTVLALLAMSAAPVFLLFLGAIVFRGAATGVVRALDRPLLSHFYPDARGRVFNFYDMVWAVGAAAGPLAVAGALALGSWRLVYVGLAVAILVTAALFWRLDAPSVTTEEEPLDREQTGQLLRTPELLAMMAALFFSTGVEAGLFTWLPYYATGELPAGLSGLTLTVMLVAYIPGRFLYGTFGERIGYLPLLVVLVAGLIPAFGFTFVLAEGVAVLAGVAVIGLLISGLYPTLVAYATDAAPEYSGPVNALAAATGALGFGTVPALMGAVIGGSGAVTAMRLLVVPVLAVLAILVVALVAGRRRGHARTGVSGGD